MPIPVITGVIRRRILLNYRGDPEVVAARLPQPFRPKLQAGHAIVGVCLIRLEQVRPRGLPSWMGIASENAASRIAVEWTDDDGQTIEGVFIPRRDTDSRLNAWAGGRVFPGVHHRSRFQVRDDQHTIHLRIDAVDLDAPLVDLVVREASELPADSCFDSLEAASAFFAAGGVGYSTRPHSCTLDGLALEVPEWRVAPLAIEHAASAWWDDPQEFPPGSIQPDHALLMRDVPHEWHARPAMQATWPQSASAPPG